MDADITVFTLDGDVIYKEPISSFDTDGLKEFRDNNGFKFQIRPRSGWEIQGIRQYEPVERMYRVTKRDYSRSRIILRIYIYSRKKSSNN